MDHGSCDKVTALLRFDAGRGGDAWQALQRWTGVYTCAYTSQAAQWGQPEPKLPRKPRYYRDDPERDAQIAGDVASLPRRPPPAPGQRSSKHGMHSDRAIRNARLPKLETSIPHCLMTPALEASR